MAERALRTVPVDGSPAALAELVGSLRAALDGTGPAVLPGPGTVPAEPPARTVPGEVAVVVATSGSTGEAKHVLLTAEALRASARATEQRLGGPGRWLLTLPAEHVAGVQVVLRALLAGADPVFQDVREGFRPDGFARAAASLPQDAPRYTSLVPTQLARILDDGGAARSALASFTAVLVGGAALDPGLRRRAEEAGVAVVTTYGMSETCGGCVYDGVPLDGVTVEIEDPDGGVPARVGAPDHGTGRIDDRDRCVTARAGDPDHGTGRADDADHPGITARINDPDRTRQGDDADHPSITARINDPDRTRQGDDADHPVGRILLGGPVVAAGYLGAASDAFVDGRFRTGDIGRWTGDRLTVLGRVDDMINTGGVKVAPAAVERALLRVPGVRAACVTGLPDPEWGQVVAALVVSDMDAAATVDAPDDRTLRERVRADEGRAAVPRVLRRAERIPERGIGKPDRAAVGRMLSDDPRD